MFPAFREICLQIDITNREIINTGRILLIFSVSLWQFMDRRILVRISSQRAEGLMINKSDR